MEMNTAVRRLGGRPGQLLRLGMRDGGGGDSTAECKGLANLTRTIRRLRPRAILVPAADDHHPDHRAVHALARKAIRRTDVELAEYAVWGVMVGEIGLAVPLAQHAARRSAALRCHASQLGLSPAGLGQGFELPRELRH